MKQSTFTHLDVHISIEELERVLQSLKDRVQRDKNTIAGQLTKSEDYSFNDTISDGDITITFHPEPPKEFQKVYREGKEVWLPSR